MKKIIVLFCCYFFSLNSFSSILIISDIDDTIKQTNVLNFTTMATSVVKKTREFNYLRDMFNYLKFHYAKNQVLFYYLSASPQCLVDNHQWLMKKNFPMGPVIQRPCNTTLLISDYTKKFKYHMLTSVVKKRMMETTLTKVLLFGDNAQFDPTVYQQIKKDFPHLEVEVFIRDIRVEATSVDVSLPVKKLEGINYFLTEFDLIDHPYFHAMSDHQKEKIKDAFKNAKLFPKYLYENLAKRYEKELAYDDDKSLILAYDALLEQIKTY